MFASIWLWSLSSCVEKPENEIGVKSSRKNRVLLPPTDLVDVLKRIKAYWTSPKVIIRRSSATSDKVETPATVTKKASRGGFSTSR